MKIIDLDTERDKEAKRLEHTLRFWCAADAGQRLAQERKKSNNRILQAIKNAEKRKKGK